MCFRWCPYRKSNETNKNWIKTSDISSELSDHVMNKKLILMINVEVIIF